MLILTLLHQHESCGYELVERLCNHPLRVRPGNTMRSPTPEAWPALTLSPGGSKLPPWPSKGSAASMLPTLTIRNGTCHDSQHHEHPA